MPRTSTTYGRTARSRLVAAAALATAAFAAASAPAEARTEALRPVADVESSWTPTAADTTSAAIDDELTHEAKPTGPDFISAPRPGHIARVELGDMALNQGESVTDANAWFSTSAKRSKRTARVRVEAWASGQLVGDKVVKATRRQRWGSFRVAVPDAAALNDLQLRFESRGRKVKVGAAYGEIITTGGEPGEEEPPGGEEPPVGGGSGEQPPVGGGSGAGNVSVYGSNVSIRPDRALPSGGSGGAELLAAKNEFESFQVAVEADSGQLNDVEVELASPLSGPGGATIPTEKVTIYREETYKVDPNAGKPRSSRQGDNGEWPDALIPEEDYFYGENRNAFPYDVPGGENVAAWIDVLAPAGTPGGSYEGSVRVSAGGNAIAEVPVRLQVIDYQLSSTPSLKSSFPVNSNYSQPCQAHTGSGCVHTSEESWRLHYLYARAGLENRITISNPMPLPFDVAPSGALAEKWLKPLIQGGTSPDAAIDNPRLAGGKLTSVKTYWQCAQQASCMNNWEALAEQWGFEDRFFSYVCDEPVNGSRPYDFDDWGDCRRNAQSAQAAWPGVRRMLTATVDEAYDADGGFDASRDVDILTPLVMFMNNRPNNPFAGNQRPQYNNFLGAGGSDAGTADNEVWMYNACSSYQCGEVEGGYWDDWAGYAIDAPPTQARSMGWLSYLYDVDGELYWNTTRHLDDAWTNSYVQGQNGDGTIFYPGKVNGGNGAPAIGGQHDIPIESIRMKRIRDGREDYDMMKALEQAGLASQAMPIITQVAGTTANATYSANATQAEVDTARCGLYTLLRPSTGNCLLG